MKKQKEIAWETEIESLMRSFCLERYARGVIENVKANATGNENEDILYERAWRQFRSIMMAS